MKKVLVLTAIAAFAAAFFTFGGTRLFTTVSAQDSRNDAALAALIKRLTDRSVDSFVEHRSADGAVSLDFGEGAQNVVVARAGADGEPITACITSIGEANAFFGRDLETGAPASSDRFAQDEISKTAARHGMDRDEFLFFKKMIEDAMASRSPEIATLTIVNADGAGEGFNDPTATTPEGGNNGVTRGEQRTNLFTFAANIWGAFLDSGVEIKVNSNFDSLTPCTPAGGVLGSAGSNGIIRDFAGAALPGTWYNRSLANKQSGTDLNGAGSAEINARFNSDVDTGCLGGGSRFYYGLDNSTPPLRINLLVVLLHEMGHGLGFSASSVNGQTGALTQGFPDVFLLKMFDKTTSKFWKDMTDAERQASALNTNNVVFDGANVKIASGFLTGGRDADGRVQLYTPNPFEPGSSISHFNTNSTPNVLMEPSINPGLPLTLDLTRQVMRDIGWYRDSDADRVPDTITAVTLAGQAVIGQQATVRWTNNGGFARNVTIELSTDGGVTFPTALATDAANAGTFNFVVPNSPTNQARIRVREAGFIDPMGVTPANFTIGNGAARTRFDYDGDGKADVSVFRPSVADWFVLNSTIGFTGIHWGATGDKPVPADFDGDGKTDIAVFRPSDGGWYWLNSSNGTFSAANFGVAEDLPTAADYDGDGKADISVFRPSVADWYRLNSSTGAFVGLHFGATEDKPAVGDFDGDGKADISVFRPSVADWYRLNSSTGAFVGLHFGATGDLPTPADYDGDGKADISVFRPSVSDWFRLNSSNGAFVGLHWGATGDRPVAADYDGDGKADIGVFRPSDGSWYQLNSTTGFQAVHFGVAEDLPTPAAFVF